MEENLKNKLGFWVFTLIVLFLAVGGYFFTDYVLININNKDETQEKEELKDYKVDKTKEYIYYKNEEVISEGTEGAEIYYKDVVINLSTQEVLNEALEKENKMYKNNIKYISQMNLISGEIINYNNDDLYALNFREYETYEFDKYVSLVINDYYYSCFDLITFDKSKSYVFNTENGKLLTEEEVLNMYNQNMEGIKEKIREKLIASQTIINEVEVIKIEDTLNMTDYALYINDYGKLYISYLVKTTQVDYNEIMEVI